MEKYGLVVPTTVGGEYETMERFNNWDKAKQAFEECTIPGKYLVQYIRVGLWSYVGMEILPRGKKSTHLI